MSTKHLHLKPVDLDGNGLLVKSDFPDGITIRIPMRQMPLPINELDDYVEIILYNTEISKLATFCTHYNLRRVLESK